MVETPLAFDADCGRMTGKPEVIPVQKSAWRKCDFIDRRQCFDFLEARFSKPVSG
jgi:hypothetical protein